MTNELLVPDMMTGEMFNMFDPNIPFINKVDSIAYSIDLVKEEIELCNERMKLWKNKKDKLISFQEELREYLRNQMSLNNNQTIKTIENTLYVSTKEVETIDENLILPKDIVKYYDYHLTFILDYDDYMGYKLNQGDYVKLFDAPDETKMILNKSKVPDKYKIKEIKNTFTLRKSTKTNV